MAESSIPVDLRNPGQVFACMGLMESAEILLGPCEGEFQYHDAEYQTVFNLTSSGTLDPVDTVIKFLTHAEILTKASKGSSLSTAGSKIRTEVSQGHEFPAPAIDAPATLPVSLLLDGHEILIEHWLDGDHSGRDNVKFWAGMGGAPGALLARNAVVPLKSLGSNELSAISADPFSFSAAMSSSFGFDWRRSYIPLDVGFSPNQHSSMTMVGYPLVELLAAIGLQNARPSRPIPRNNLIYRYGVSNARLPTVFARAVLGGQSLGFPIRLFRMSLGWPGQERQARCIIDAQEEFA